MEHSRSPKVDGVAVRVRHDLDLDVAGLLDEFLGQDAVVAEARPRLVGGAVETVAAFRVVAHHAHAFAAAPGAGLEHYRIADLPATATAWSGPSITPPWPGMVFTPASAAMRLEVILSPMLVIACSPGPMKVDPGGGERAGELRVFRKEAVAGMHRIRSGALDGAENPVDAQVAVRRGGLADAHRLVGHAHVQGPGIGIGMNRDRGDAHPAGGPDHAAGDLTTIGYQYFLEHLL